MISICHISSEDFLEDVKIQIKKQFKNQDNFAEIIYLSRKQLNRILNNADDLTVHWIKEFCEKLGLDLRNYIFEQMIGTQVLFFVRFFGTKQGVRFLALYSSGVERQRRKTYGQKNTRDLLQKFR